MRGTGRFAATALMALLMAFLLASCGGGDSSDSTSAGDTQVAEAQGDSSSEDTTSQDSSQPADDDGKPKPSDGGDSTDGETSPDGGSAPESDGSDDGQGGGGGQGDGSSKGDGNAKGGTSKKGGRTSQPEASNGLKGAKDFGSEAAASESEEAQVAIESYMASYKKEDWPAVCGMLAKPVLVSLAKIAASFPQLKSTDCLAIFNGGLAPVLGSTANIDSVSSFRIEGGVGYAFYQNDQLVMLMRKEDGKWKVNGIMPEPVP